MWRPVIAALVANFILAVPAASRDGDGLSAPDYAETGNWLCRPENLRFCETDLDTTIVHADGTREHQTWAAPAQAPAIDCFYLYPTASLDEASNSDLVPGEQAGEEIHDVRRHFARFAGACRLFAPIYRSTTATQMRGLAPPGDREMAYADVLAAWKHYLASDNGGRGVVLIGHSQGANHIRRLLMEEIDGKPAQALLVSALAIGANVLVPEGKDAGGDLQQIPVCRTLGQTGCLIAYNTYRADAPPPKNAVLGGRTDNGMRFVCVNPAALSGGEAPLDAYLETRYEIGAAGALPQAPWVTGGAPVATRYVRLPGLLRGECRSDDRGDYLALTIDADPADPRVDDIKGEIVASGKVLPEWGFHMIDMELALGDLVRVVAAQAETWERR
jgi:hypothetical protein